VIHDGRHAAAATIGDRFAAALAELGGTVRRA